ncbi:eukaryotic translation initiation factor 5B-like [Phoenix dactylifera]|uniref:Eukaryotic translation initiation factor 5B n=1 Tax=Phoenix dactylifera TaxID=42345 RepID=A0A8B7CX27_PHODC|nr:eukaryotic translation initiation factor 5B-like [Phoenix dactylifera]
MGRKKNVTIADDEYSMPQDDPAEPPPPSEGLEENRVAPKKSKKGGKVQRNADKGDDAVEPEKPAVADDAQAAAAAAEDEDEIPVVFAGKKKSSKSKKNTGVFSAFNALDALGDEENNKEPDPEPRPKPKSKPEVNNHVVEDEEDESGDLDGEFGRQGGMGDVGSKKQQKKKKKKGGRTAQEEEDLDKLLAELGEGPPVASTAPPPVPEEQAEEGDDTEIKDADLESNKQGAAPEEAASKKKKKKKKNGRTAQEEEDLDKLLAELGEGPAPPPIVEETSPVLLEQAEVAGDEKDGEAENVESAAAKKKKKKKEKGKEKKAAAAAAPSAVEAKEEKKEEAKGKGPDKKLPKHVREMQEALARRKEAEDRRKREEEERLRKEEEERKRLEELERLAEEAKRRKKEKEKEKLLKKKQEGKLLTGRQKEEQRRLEAMRKQFLAQSEVPIGDAGGETKKRPKYETKKTKHTQAKAVEVEKVTESQAEADEPTTEPAVEDAMAEEESVSQVEEAEDNVEASQEPEEVKAMEDDEDEDEWDAKSWDDVDVTLPATSAFAEEDQEEVEAKPVVRKGAERVEPQTHSTVTTKPTVKKVVAPCAPSKKTGVESRENERENVPTTITGRGNEVVTKQESRTADVKSKKSGNDLRSPICCILGHVDTGKTKLLDCIRRTNVQEGEAGGITQQIGATYFPTENIRERTRELKADATLKVPGLLVIDTPGHESFTNLRSRGSSLCDIAILVVDIMHGLEPQTIESLNLLKRRNTEFIVALNKVDRLYGWKTCLNAPIVKALKQQSNDVKNEFNMRLTQIITQFKEQGLNTALYYKNREMGETFNIVPTSAISGEGIPDLLLLLVQWAQKTMEEKLTYVDEVQCTVLEVKVIEGLGTTIDVVLVNGVLHEGDQIVICGMQGPIVTNIRALLTPHPMKELRVKGSYLHHKELKAAQGVKISAQGLEHAIAGTALYVVKPEDDLEDVKEAVMQEMNKVMSRIDKSGEGVYVQASTLGSLEALSEFLKSPDVNIPFSDFSIGPVHKKDVMKASVMLERKKEYATILAFDVKVMPDARELAEETGVRIFVADIIYHLFDQFKAYIDNLKEEKKKESAEEAVFPCVLSIMPNCIFNKKDPIVLGVDVLEGIAKVGTPICIPSRDFIDIGRIASIEINHKHVDVATKGQKVAIKIVGSNSEEQQKMYGRHFDIDDELVSHISRRSIDTLKANYRDELSLEEWRLVVRLKQIFKIP